MDSEPGTEGDQDGSEQEGDMAGREHSLKDEHASYGPDRGDTSRSQETETMMQPWAMYWVLLSHINCTSLKSTKRWAWTGLPPLSVCEADQWLESWHVIASSAPSQQVKLSKSAPKSVVSF